MLSQSAKTICLPPTEVRKFWPFVSHWILDAYEGNESDDTFEEVEDAVFNARALVWLAVLENKPTAAAVSKVWTAGKKKICTVLAVGGEGDDWPELLKPIEQYAKLEGCASVRLEGRKGWARVFKDYAQPWIVLEKKVN